MLTDNTKTAKRPALIGSNLTLTSTVPKIGQTCVLTLLEFKMNKLQKISIFNKYSYYGLNGYFEDGGRSGPYVRIYFYPDGDGAGELVASIFVSYGNEINTQIDTQREKRIIEFAEKKLNLFK